MGLLKKLKKTGPVTKEEMREAATEKRMEEQERHGLPSLSPEAYELEETGEYLEGRGGARYSEADLKADQYSYAKQVGEETGTFVFLPEEHRERQEKSRLARWGLAAWKWTTQKKGGGGFSEVVEEPTAKLVGLPTASLALYHGFLAKPSGGLARSWQVVNGRKSNGNGDVWSDVPLGTAFEVVNGKGKGKGSWWRKAGGAGKFLGKDIVSGLSVLALGTPEERALKAQQKATLQTYFEAGRVMGFKMAARGAGYKLGRKEALGLMGVGSQERLKRVSGLLGGMGGGQTFDWGGSKSFDLFFGYEGARRSNPFLDFGTSSRRHKRRGRR